MQDHARICYDAVLIANISLFPISDKRLFFLFLRKLPFPAVTHCWLPDLPLG